MAPTRPRKRILTPLPTPGLWRVAARTERVFRRGMSRSACQGSQLIEVLDLNKADFSLV